MGKNKINVLKKNNNIKIFWFVQEELGYKRLYRQKE